VKRSHAVAVVVAVALVAALAGGAVRLVTLGERAMAASDEALANGDAIAAIDQAKLAAEAALPGSPWSERGYARLETIASDARARNDEATAGRAWRAMRSAATATRVLGGGEVERRRAQANAALAHAANDEQAMAAELAREETPATSTFVLLALVAIAFYAAAAFALARIGVDAPKRQ
jgi:hypothetical protein